jgi:hypothetical protein
MVIPSPQLVDIPRIFSSELSTPGFGVGGGL